MPSLRTRRHFLTTLLIALAAVLLASALFTSSDADKETAAVTLT